jgi:isocitrate/isopropylmalate dehydrogenase
MGDGLFISVCKEVAKKYPQIIYQEEQVDTICMKLARDPSELDVMVMPNLYGDIVSDLCAGIFKRISIYHQVLLEVSDLLPQETSEKIAQSSKPSTVLPLILLERTSLTPLLC